MIWCCTCEKRKTLSHMAKTYQHVFFTMQFSWAENYTSIGHCSQSQRLSSNLSQGVLHIINWIIPPVFSILPSLLAHIKLILTIGSCFILCWPFFFFFSQHKKKYVYLHLATAQLILNIDEHNIWSIFSIMMQVI